MEATHDAQKEQGIAGFFKCVQKPSWADFIANSKPINAIALDLQILTYLLD